MRKVKDLPEGERPREKGFRLGAGALSNRELLAVLIRCGTNGQSALDTADVLLQKAGSVAGIAGMSDSEIASVRGMSRIKALEIKACLELSRRMLYEEVRESDVVSSPEAVISWLRMSLGQEAQEKFMVIYMDHAKHVLKAVTLFSGTADMCPVSPREIFREALRLSGTCIMLVHNHPSGNLTPSDADIRLTERVCEAGALMGIPVIDHLIVSSSGYFSFLREGILQESMTKGR